MLPAGRPAGPAQALARPSAAEKFARPPKNSPARRNIPRPAQEWEGPRLLWAPRWIAGPPYGNIMGASPRPKPIVELPYLGYFVACSILEIPLDPSVRSI